MYNLAIPHPKYPLKKYSTRQLKAWHETCVLMEAIADEEYNKKGQYDGSAIRPHDIVRSTRWGIYDVLQERGVSHEELERTLRYTKEDVQA